MFLQVVWSGDWTTVVPFAARDGYGTVAVGSDVYLFKEVNREAIRSGKALLVDASD